LENNAERILGLDELGGLKELGMKRETLREARRLLKSRDLMSDDFNKALNAILAQVDKLNFLKKRRHLY
jgi:hypothetical protein